MSNRKYTSEHLGFIRDNVAGRSFAELTDLFNKQFGTDYPVSTVTSTAFRYGYRNGRDAKFNKGWEPTQFKKGHVPHNKGKKGVRVSPATEFKKGYMPQTWKPVGTETVRSDGYTWVKVAEPNKWREKHLIIWEAENGPVPKGYVVIFADGNRLNITLENLLLISRKELAVMNKRGLISVDAELTKVGITIADLHLKIGERKRQSKRRLT